MNRATRRVGWVGAAGAVIGIGIGLGSYNPWPVSLIVGIPLVTVGLAVVLRVSRASEYERFRLAAASDGVPTRIEALTRSSVGDGDLQPTLMVATISPPHDTEYQGRWIASMSGEDFKSLADSPVTALAPDRLPSREVPGTPSFNDRRRTWALISPALSILVATAALFGVGDAWHISLTTPAASTPSVHNDSKSKSMELNARRDGMIRAITEQFGPAATNNLLDLRFTGSGSDYGTVLDPTNGAVSIVYINNNGDAFTTASPQVLRKDSTFTAGEIASIDLGALIEKMAHQADSAQRLSALGTLEIKRSGPGAPVILTGSFGRRSINALPNGTVGEIFDPADFAVSFQRARDALRLAGITASDRVLTDFEIRGSHRATPIARPSEVQNTGGVVLEFVTGDRSGQIVLVPGEIPKVTDKSYRSASQPFAFDDVSAEVFESVRAQAMQRGALEPYEREAVDIWVGDQVIDPFRLAIRVELAGVDAASGTYSLDGRFLAPGSR
ncbi:MULTISPECIES: hypothetical protein [Mycobacteroides]|uniref:hypothetical protein n=1 Tax=Mycobacteroides TaxID=670516 RepID=UPI00046AE4FE|nr:MULTISPECIES: hypothetical protein [Mycobacteroides]AYM42148.1 hypothetical protein DYE20_11805 [[Mycobacterium] chelonae subsp. gwanakae]RIR63577.1 hypothetical protein D2E62_18460 [Mycobacteroides abscessus]RIS44576.1 hypothetical protein D2E48_08165 [Mycobacteroides abscessus]RIS75577.1 hypothetical protein D2E59_08160 [Mycobacteroides abscessus]RIS84031.1 hypothetical protein D2E44_13130 [Mycobacteroides abscessus]